MRLFKSQVDQVDSPPSAGLTTNQYKSRLIAVNSQIGRRRSSRVPDRSQKSLHDVEFLMNLMNLCVEVVFHSLFGASVRKLDAVKTRL